MRNQVRHAGLVIGAYSLLFGWLFARPVVYGGYIAEADLYETFLPAFFSPLVTWSSFEFGGAPIFADPGEATVYPLHVLFARIVGSWTAYIASAFIVAACGAYAYVYAITRSRLAAACAGVAFALSETLSERIAHVATLHTMAWLPLIALSVDRLRGDRWRLWMAIGALALASSFLAGQPQVFLYGAMACAAYALVGGLVERAGIRYYVAGLAMAALAALVMAVKALPLLEASTYTSRQTMNFGQFVSHANTPAQLLSMIVPAIIHEGREAPTYVGLLTLLFTFVAMRRVVSNWRVGFWVVTGVIAVMLGLGAETPAAAIAYQVPFYDRFRIVGRHLFLAAFAASALAGIGVAAVQRRAVSFRAGAVAAGVLAAIVAAAVLAINLWPTTFVVASPGELPWPMFGDNTVGSQIALAAMSIAAALAFLRRPNSRLTMAGLVVVLATDLIWGVAYYMTPAGFVYELLPPSAMQPSVHAVRLRESLTATHQRLLSPAGTHLDAIGPAIFARLWQMPIAGGYGPMLIGHYADLAMMQRNGSVDPALLADSNAALDLMAVKYVVLPAGWLHAGARIERHGLPWTAEEISLPVGPPECGQRHTRHATYTLPAEMRISAIAMAVVLRCAEDVAQGTEVAAMHVVGPEGGFRFPLRAGIEVSEETLSDPQQRRRARHAPAAIFDDAAPQYSYVMRADLPRPVAGGRLEFALSGTAGSMEIERLTVIAADGTPHPLSGVAAMVADRARWRVVDSLKTSRLTDRGGDESGQGEEPYVIVENLRARPRAWVASEVLALTGRDRDNALHYSLLPDGRRFDPAKTAVVDPGGVRLQAGEVRPKPDTTYAPGTASVGVRSISDGAIWIDVSTEGGAFLVLSETFYPGWRARIDGAETAVHLTNGALQGVHVPAGQHEVEFVFEPTSLAVGRLLSAIGCALAVVVVVWGERRARVRRPAPALLQHAP
jgi:hypothetical protein